MIGRLPGSAAIDQQRYTQQGNQRHHQKEEREGMAFLGRQGKHLLQKPWKKNRGGKMRDGKIVSIYENGQVHS